MKIIVAKNLSELKQIVVENKIGADWLSEELRECELNEFNAMLFTLLNGDAIEISVEQMRALIAE